MATDLVSLQLCCDAGTNVFAAAILGHPINYLGIKRGRPYAGLADSIIIFVIGWLSNWSVASLAAVVIAVLIFKKYRLAKEGP